VVKAESAQSESGFMAHASVDFVDLHGGVDGEIGIANGGAGPVRAMPRRSGEITTGTFERVGITVALGARHGKRIGGDEFVERKRNGRLVAM